MNEYIIYTAEGSTMSPNEDEVENCQVLGVVTAINAKLAPTALVRQFPAVKDWGFKMSKTFVRQVVTKKQQTELKKLLNALTSKNSTYGSICRMESSSSPINKGGVACSKLSEQKLSFKKRQ